VANLAFSLQLAGQEEEALEHYALARSLGDSQPLLLVNEAIAHVEIGDLAAAEAAARQALEMDAGLAPAHVVLGAVDLQREDPQRASLSLAEAIRLAPGYAPAHFYLGLAYKSLGQPAEAASAFERARALLAEPLAQSEAQRHLNELYARSGSDGASIQPHEGEEGR
jgi:tetratricopeptide (TPR) repeat protein